MLLACSVFQRWSLLSLWKYLGAGPLLGPCPHPFLDPVFCWFWIVGGGGGLVFCLGLFPFIMASAFGCQLGC